MIRAGLESRGSRVHVYTSPHLARFHERIRLAGVGPLSRVSHTVIALACVGLGYHIAAHAFQWPLRAPMGTAVAVAAVAVLGSIAIDALEARADRRSGPPRDGGGAP